MQMLHRSLQRKNIFLRAQFQKFFFSFSIEKKVIMTQILHTQILYLKKYLALLEIKELEKQIFANFTTKH